MEDLNTPMFPLSNDAIVIGLLALILGFVFKTSSIKTGGWKRFYTFVPALLLCYFIPSIFNSLGIIDGETSKLYFVASRYLLPTSLVLLTLSIDLKEIWKLRAKAGVMFLAGTAGIIIGGPLAILITSTFAPDVVGGQGPEEVWRGLSTIAGSWIGGSANQAAMLEVFKPSGELFSATIAVDVIVANIWMAILLLGVGKSKKIDKFFNADSSSVETLKLNVEKYQASIAKIPTLSDIMIILGIGLAATGIGHFFADLIAPYIETNFPDLKKFSLTSGFFWLIIITTTIGVVLSFTKARKLEGAGASKIGSAMLYILVATIGMKMDVLAIFDNPGLFGVGFIWMIIHVIVLLSVAKLIKAPFFFVAVGSQANVGGAASAPIVAGAFHPSLAPIGVLLAVFGYAVGTYGAWLCGILMQMAS